MNHERSLIDLYRVILGQTKRILRNTANRSRGGRAVLLTSRDDILEDLLKVDKKETSTLKRRKMKKNQSTEERWNLVIKAKHFVKLGALSANMYLLYKETAATEQETTPSAGGETEEEDEEEDEEDEKERKAADVQRNHVVELYFRKRKTRS